VTEAIELFDPNAYKSQVQAEFRRLLGAAEKENQLYFLMTMFGGWAAVRWSGLFVAHVNEITTRLILDRARLGSTSPVAPHEILFALQINLEAKAVYAVIRNLVFVATGKHARPEPWDPKRGEYYVYKNGNVAISTRRILSNLVQDFRDAGFTLLADELERTHITSVGYVRNAIAHSMFRFPGPETNGKWVFATYAESTPGFLTIVPHEYTNDEFQEIGRRFFGFRLGFAAAYDECRASYHDRKFDFQAENQMKPGEILHCTFDRGSVAVKHKGTPLW
jgi:hypothetical protein